MGRLMQTTLENIKDMVDVNTVIGEPIQAGNGATIIPISKVSFGFLAGGGDHSAPAQPEKEPEALPFAGGGGAGVSVQPVGFLVVGADGVKMLPAQHLTPWEHALNCAPQLLDDLKALVKPGQDAEPKGAMP